MASQTREKMVRRGAAGAEAAVVQAGVRPLVEVVVADTLGAL